MKIAAGSMALALGLMLFGPAGLEAAWGRKGKKLPKPIDYPVVRKGVPEYHKPGKRSGKHPSQYQRYGWGTRRHQVLGRRPVHFGHYLYDRY